jgi:hypothetical protein
MTLAALCLLVLVFGLVAFDWATLRGKNRRALFLEVAVFLGGALFIVFPERATALAHMVGIGRGVDFLLYPTVIWLVRESLLSRRRRMEDSERLTHVVRELAMLRAENVQSAGEPSHSASVTASLTA